MMMNQQTDVLIIGAGAAGLMAARTLAEAGQKVLVLEARDRTGGRIHTVKHTGLGEIAELGAEFIHGQLPVTLRLLKEAGISVLDAVGDMWRYEEGKFKQPHEIAPYWDELMQKLSMVRKDLSLSEFLAKYFADAKYADMREKVKNFAAGYDTADPDKASTLNMRAEMQSEDDEHQYRIEGGYGNLISYLEKEIRGNGGEIKLSSVAKMLEWQEGEVCITTSNGDVYKAQKAVIALPVGVLKANKNEPAAITFEPAIPETEKAIMQLGMGAVIKLLLNFKTLFWEEQALKQGADEAIKEMSYLFTDEAIPTYWTQTPAKSTLLTGWIGGPAAAELKHAEDDHILKLALQSLSNIFKLDVDELQEQLSDANVLNWTAEPFTLGSYSYAKVTTKQALKVLTRPVNNTIYFAGEAIYDGPETGTVEAALASGKKAAEMMLS
jgi:monoamine oxidase